MSHEERRNKDPHFKLKDGKTELQHLWVDIHCHYDKSGDYQGYLVRIAQIDEKSQEKYKKRYCPNSPISVLVKCSDMLDMRCFPIGGMENQHDAILESTSATEEIIIPLTRLPSTTYSLFLTYFFSLFVFKPLKDPLFSYFLKSKIILR